MIKDGDVCFSGKLHCPGCRVKIGSYSWLYSHYHHHPNHKHFHRLHHWGFAITIIILTNILTFVVLPITTYIIITIITPKKNSSSSSQLVTIITPPNISPYKSSPTSSSPSSRLARVLGSECPCGAKVAPAFTLDITAIIFKVIGSWYCCYIYLASTVLLLLLLSDDWCQYKWQDCMKLESHPNFHILSLFRPVVDTLPVPVGTRQGTLEDLLRFWNLHSFTFTFISQLLSLYLSTFPTMHSSKTYSEPTRLKFCLSPGHHFLLHWQEKIITGIISSMY